MIASIAIREHVCGRNGEICPTPLGRPSQAEDSALVRAAGVSLLRGIPTSGSSRPEDIVSACDHSVADALALVSDSDGSSAPVGCYTDVVSPIEQTLRATLGAREDVELAVLFGSAVDGALTGSSDVDLAVRWRGDAPPDRDALLATIERSVGRAVDVVDLDGAPPQLRFEIARSGVVIVERGAGTWAAFRARAFTDWWDFRPIARRIHRAAIARLRARR
jgi:predicted nucleotidyltransferase